MKIARRSKVASQQLAHVTQEMYKQNLELAERNKTLTLLRKIDEVVLGSATRVSEITRTISNVLVDDTDFTFSAIYVDDKYKTHVTAHGVACQQKIPKDVQDLIKISLQNLPLHSGSRIALSHAISTREIQITDSFTQLRKAISADEDESLKTALGVQSLFVCPLRATNRFLGILVVGVPIKSGELSAFIKNLTERLSGTVSIAVENHLLYEELQEVSARLRVQNRRLRELDKTKDEFISMASHQLRTPLTAVKGYLSMILEGDTGPIEKNQKEMIQRSYDGAQKMVYLIADMLNVSRLQTGKFLIDNKPTSLPDVVQGEVDQLREEASQKKITLSFKKPTTYPTLNLDETKIRQVIMNFLDNALYYTPSGGQIEVKLDQTPESTMYTVTDTGVGVPKDVQHHLFSKFYRADNARKMRPDGTGLGLYMAKKVVTAQGGAIIFKSEEGKGSTFGFSFPRATTEVSTKK